MFLIFDIKHDIQITYPGVTLKICTDIQMKQNTSYNYKHGI